MEPVHKGRKPTSASVGGTRAAEGAGRSAGTCAWTGFLAASSQPPARNADKLIPAKTWSRQLIFVWYEPALSWVNAFRRGWVDQITTRSPAGGAFPWPQIAWPDDSQLYGRCNFRLGPLLLFRKERLYDVLQLVRTPHVARKIVHADFRHGPVRGAHSLQLFLKPHR